jgi:hypothetical protein
MCWARRRVVNSRRRTASWYSTIRTLVTRTLSRCLNGATLQPPNGHYPEYPFGSARACLAALKGRAVMPLVDADDRTYDSNRTGVDAELVALGVGHGQVGVDPVQLHGPRSTSRVTSASRSSMRGSR